MSLVLGASCFVLCSLDYVPLASTHSALLTRGKDQRTKYKEQSTKHEAHASYFIFLLRRFRAPMLVRPLVRSPTTRQGPGHYFQIHIVDPLCANPVFDNFRIVVHRRIDRRYSDAERCYGSFCIPVRLAARCLTLWV
jgi:hypothetical protein